MIYLFTGANGSRKTASAIHFLLTQKQFKGRPIYFNHVNNPLGLRKAGWIEIDDDKVRDWSTLPHGSVIFVDETWRIFPSRPDPRKQECPQYCLDLKEHRKDGFDFIFVTQMPGDLDNKLRGLVSQHRHLVQIPGMKYSKQYFYTSCQESDTLKNPSKVPGVIESRQKVPSKVFKMYDSTVLDTHGVRLNPKMMLALGIAGLAALYIGVRVPDLLSKLPDGSDDPPPVAQVHSDSTSTPQSVPVDSPAVDYFTSNIPRVPGMPWTAPIYDKLTEPTDVPKPKAVIHWHTGKRVGQCITYSQQGTLMDVSRDLCLHIVKYGWFDATKSADLDKQSGGAESASAEPRSAPQSLTTEKVLSL